MERPPTPGRGAPDPDPDRLVGIASFASPVEAHLARGRLLAEGIEAALTGEHAAGLLSGLQGVRLWVREADRDRALALIPSEAPSGVRRSAHFVTADLDAPRCPRCQGLAVEADPLQRPLLAFAWRVLGVPMPALRARRRCRLCGKSWRAESLG
jgi:hypothetical protein